MVLHLCVEIYKGKTYRVTTFLLRNPSPKFSTIFYEIVRYHKVAYRR